MGQLNHPQKGSIPTVNVRKRILIIDDEPGIVLALSRLIVEARPQYLVHTAETGEQALEMIERSTFDLIITDFRLPGMDGLRLAQEAHRLSSETWSILMTAFGTDGVRGDAYAEGFVAYLHKPFDLSLLLEWIDRSMNREETASSVPLVAQVDNGEDAANKTDLLSAFNELIDDTGDKPWFTPSESLPSYRESNGMLLICKSILSLIR